jgi:glycosyltransferase involved in cell wall biosynthesis
LPGGRNIACLLEHASTIILSVKLRSTLSYDVLYIRDADPFIFIPFLVCCFSKDYRLVCSLIGTRAVRSNSSRFHKFIGNRGWKPVYRRALSRNKFTFICESSCLKDYFELKFLDGILSGKINIVPLGMETTSMTINQRQARRYLKLPEDRTIFLHFGTLHPDKDIETILAAIGSIPAVLVHAGRVWPWANRMKPVNINNMESKVIIRECYIPEVEKQYYFAAADAIVLSYKKDFLAPGSMLWEAAKFKLPAIASDNVELEKLVLKYKIGLVFKAEEVASLSKTLVDFLECSKDEREAIANNCERFSRDYSFQVWAHRFIKVLTELRST